MQSLSNTSLNLWLIFSAYIGSFIMVIIQHYEEGQVIDEEGEVSNPVLKPLCTAIVFNAIWLLVQSVFKEVKVQERSAHLFAHSQINEMPDALSMV